MRLSGQIYLLKQGQMEEVSKELLTNTHGQLVAHLDCKVVICKASFRPLGPQHVLMFGVISPQVQNFIPPLIEV